MTAEREGVKAFQAAKNHTFFVILLPKNARERDQAATRSTFDLRLVDFLPIKNNWSGSLYLATGQSRRTPKLWDPVLDPAKSVRRRI